MPLIYNDRTIRGPAWCGDCDRPRDECACEAIAKENMAERSQLRRDLLWVIETERPGIRRSYRRGYVICRKWAIRQGIA